MDVIGFSEAATANSRIEIINANPDSTSGIVTVPKTIASGETITIPAGRIAVLPNIQIDGTLDIQGDVFIPSGSTFDDLDSQIALKAPLDSPALTGTPTAPTQTAGDNSTKVATTAYVDGKMVRGIAVTASGTSIDFTGIPSWVKRITVMFNGVSTNGSSPVQVQLGDSGGVEASGYVAVAVAYSGSPSSSAFTTGFGLIDSPSGAASYFYNGFLDFVNISNTSWVCSATIQRSPTGASTVAGSKTLSSTLDRVRITTVNGADTFDSGSINILYEG